MSLKAMIVFGALIAMLAGIAAVLGVHELPRSGGWYVYAFVDIFAGVGSLMFLLLAVRLEKQQERFFKEIQRFDQTILKAIKALEK